MTMTSNPRRLTSGRASASRLSGRVGAQAASSVGKHASTQNATISKALRASRAIACPPRSRSLNLHHRLPCRPSAATCYCLPPLPLTAKSPPQIRQTRERRDNCKHEQWDPETAKVSGESNSCYESAGACDRCNDNEEPRLVRACDDRREEDCIPASPLNPPFTLLAATDAGGDPPMTQAEKIWENFETTPSRH